MKVLHLISGLRGGGAEHFVLELCRQSNKDPKTEMSVLTVAAADEISYKFREAGIEVITASADQESKRGAKALEAFRLLLEQPHEVYHAHMFHACIIACVAKIFQPSVKVVFTLHNNHVPQFHRRLLLFITRPLRNADITFPGMKRKWFQKKKTETVPNGVDINRFNVYGVKPPIFTCGFVGRLEHEKNPLFLIDIAKSFSGQNFMISIAGEGPLNKELENRIAAENLQRHFNVMGHLNDVTVLLARSHCLLLPSLWEGMPLALLEAAAAGVPVVTTPVGVIPSMVSDSEGYVGELNSFVDMINQVMNNYDEALIKAKKLKEKVVASYSIERSYSLYKTIYSH